MATYVLGDVQGCAATLRRLLARLDFDPRADRIALVGDLVNRGPDSLAVLRWASDHDACVDAVLGNHDLHLLAVAAGVVPSRPSDTLHEVLRAPDRERLLDWLAARPLLLRVDGWTVVHAGLPPHWTTTEAAAHAAAVPVALSGLDRAPLLAALRTGDELTWDPDADETARMAYVVAALTRLRVVAPDGRLVLGYKGPPGGAPAGCRPWFEAPGRASAGEPIAAGHWAALGLVVRDDLLALDTGCVWGGELSAVRLDDGALFSEPCADDVPRHRASDG